MSRRYWRAISFRKRHHSAAFGFTLIRGFHESKHLQGLVEIHWRGACLEKLHDFNQQRSVSRRLVTGMQDGLLTKHLDSVVLLSLSNAAHHAQPAVVPLAGYDISPLRGHS